MNNKKRKPGTPWPKDDEWALLGLLDFCIKYARPFNEENVTAHLCSAGSLYDDYTWTQVTGKLSRLYNSCGSEKCTSEADLYKKGSACLTGLREEFVERPIEPIVERLENLLKPTRLRKKRLKNHFTRKTPKSNNPFTIKEGQNHTPECSASDRERLTPRAQRHQTRELVKQSNWSWESSQERLFKDDTSRKKRVRIEKDSRKEDNLPAEKGPENKEKEFENQSVEQPASECVEPSTEIEGDHDFQETSALERRGRAKSIPLRRLGSEIRQLQGDPVPSPATLERIHKASLRKKEVEIIGLKETIRANKEKFKEFEIQLDSFESVQEMRQEGEEPLEVLVSNLNQEVRHLKSANDECRKIGTFAKLAGRYNAARGEMHMNTQISIIRSCMKSILGNYKDDASLNVPSFKVSNGLNKLLSFAFCLNYQTTLGKKQFEMLISNRPPSSVIENLVEAAVCTWVFESEFPYFQQACGDLSLLTKYRELIVAQDGAVSLRNLELASYHALINTPIFDHLISEESQDLAASLSKTLAPFFARNAEESDDNVFETWGEEEDV